MCGRRSIKKIRPRDAKSSGRNLLEKLFPAFLRRCRSGGLGGLGLGHALLEFIHAPGGIHKLLRPGIKWMAGVANTDNYGLFYGTSRDDVPASATDFRCLIVRMNVRF